MQEALKNITIRQAIIIFSNLLSAARMYQVPSKDEYPSRYSCANSAASSPSSLIPGERRNLNPRGVFLTMGETWLLACSLPRECASMVCIGMVFLSFEVELRRGDEGEITSIACSAGGRLGRATRACNNHNRDHCRHHR